MASLLAKIGGWLAGSVLPVFLNFVFGKLVEIWNEYRTKKTDDKKVDDAVDKSKDPDLEKGLEGIDELEKGFNDHS